MMFSIFIFCLYLNYELGSEGFDNNFDLKLGLGLGLGIPASLVIILLILIAYFMAAFKNTRFV